MTEKSILQGTKINSTFLALCSFIFYDTGVIILSMLEYFTWNIESKYVYLVYGRQIHSKQLPNIILWLANNFVSKLTEK